jgi:valyl-tRNA synthetase
MPPEIPDPLLDKKEIAAEKHLVVQYEKFCKPGRLGSALNTAGKTLVKLIPAAVKKRLTDVGDGLSEAEVFKEALKLAGKGFGTLVKLTATHTVSKNMLLNSLRRSGSEVEAFEYIPFLRGYEVERAVHRAHLLRMAAAATEGAITGFPGAVGIPFNLVLSFFLFFRATQAIALTYGYDVQDDPGELAIASEVTLQSLEPRLAPSTGGISASMAKLMAASQLVRLQSGLTKRLTYETMLKNGGMQAMFVQLRAAGHATARKALQKSGQKTLEAGIFMGLVEKAGAVLSKRMVAKSIPIFSALISAGIDSYLMNRVLVGSNLAYHKRFLLEKAFRIEEVVESADARKRKRPTSKSAARRRKPRPKTETRAVAKKRKVAMK